MTNLEQHVQQEVRANLHNAHELEQLYRNNPHEFSDAITVLLKEFPSELLIQAWHERLHGQVEMRVHDAPGTTTSSRFEQVGLTIFFALIAGVFVRILFEYISSGNDSLFFKNISFAIIWVLTLYMMAIRNPSKTIKLAVAGITLVLIAYINLLPPISAHTSTLAALHTPIFLIAMLGLVFAGRIKHSLSTRIEFLRYIGETVMFMALLQIGGMVLSMLTMGLFSVINVDIFEFYSENVSTFGAAAIPFVATYITLFMFKGAARNIAPSLARIFSPLFLVMLSWYVIVLAGSLSQLFNNRDTLLIFNVMLALVLSMTIFIISERNQSAASKIHNYIILGLVSVALIIDCMALSAIIFRLNEYGISPNRVAVLGENILIFFNLAGILIIYIRMLLQKKFTNDALEKFVARYLPAYAIWAAIVIFLFPLVFKFI